MAKALGPIPGKPSEHPRAGGNQVQLPRPPDTGLARASRAERMARTAAASRRPEEQGAKG